MGNAGRSLMVSAGFLLKKLADEHNLAVLVSMFALILHSQVAE